MEQIINANLAINNVPIYAYNKDYLFWVIRLCEGLWFYGAYDTVEDANKAASEISNGFVITNPDILNNHK